MPADIPALPAQDPDTLTTPQSFRDIAEMFREKQEMLLYSQLYNFMVPVSFAAGKVDIWLDPAGDSSAPGTIKKHLSDWTKTNWIISLVPENRKTAEMKTLADEDREAQQQKLANAANHPIVKDVLARFPGARLSTIRDIAKQN